jgi:dihydropteroate synthase
MTRETLYLRPIGLLYGAAANAAGAEGVVLPLAGGPIAFAAAELIEGEAGSARRQIFTARALAEARDTDLASLLKRVTAPRPPFARSPSTPGADGHRQCHAGQLPDGGLYDSERMRSFTRPSSLQPARQSLILAASRRGRSLTQWKGRLAHHAGDRGSQWAARVISIDTRKATVAQAAAKAGAKIFNDVSALNFDPDSLKTAVATGLAVVLMHAQGEPKTMQDDPRYADVVLDVFDYLRARIEAAVAAGIDRSRIAADPGLGFGKTLAHNLALLAHTSLLHGLGVPLLIGVSRKRFIQGVAGGAEPQAREPGSQAAAIVAAAQGAQILRVHDVAGSRQALGVWWASAFGTEN